MNVYLKRFILPDRIMEDEWLFSGDESHKASLAGVYRSFYPFHIFTKYRKAPVFDFSPITVIYGSNGSGKSTLLNVIAEKIELDQRSPFESTDFFPDYCGLCHAYYDDIPRSSKLIKSDDVFKTLYDVRGINQMIDNQRDEVWERMAAMKSEARIDPSVLRLRGLDDFERWDEYHKALKQTTSKFIRDRVQKNLESASNGETAMKFFVEEITENALYLLDEPENSLSPMFQLELKKIIEESARFFGCQFIISSHSPILLSLEGAKIYNLDDECEVYNWYDLEEIKVYAKFFKENEKRFL